MAQLYKDFKPTAFDTPANFMAHDDIDYLATWLVVPCGRNRDSSILDESNFDAALEILGGESDTVEIHRFGHWACGWYELLLAHPQHADKVDEIERALAGYPVLNEEDFSEREWNCACDIWERANLEDRIDYIKRYARDSIFAARRDTLPNNIEISSLVGN